MTPSDYQYDVFVSYKRNTPVEAWVKRYLAVELRKWLPECMRPGYEPRVFVDSVIPIGNKWPSTLANALHTSRLLVPVLNSPYCASEWCMTEFRSMRAREQLLSLGDGTLIYPLIFFDGDFFPEEISEIQGRKMHDWACDAPSFGESSKYLSFIEEIKLIAMDLAARLNEVPEFDPTWPSRISVSDSVFPHPANEMQAPMV